MRVVCTVLNMLFRNPKTPGFYTDHTLNQFTGGIDVGPEIFF